MNKTVTSVVALSLTTATAPPAFVAICDGDSRCRACKNGLYAQGPQSGSERQRKERMVANTSGRLTMSAKSLPELLDAAHMALAADLLEIPAALVAIQLVWRITRLQQQARVQAGGELSAPPCIGG